MYNQNLDNDESPLFGIFGLFSKSMNFAIDNLMPNVWKIKPDPEDDVIPTDAGQALRTLQNERILGQITLAEYVQARKKILLSYQLPLHEAMDEYGKPVDYCSSCHAPLPSAPTGICEYCRSPYDKSEGQEIARAILSTDS